MFLKNNVSSISTMAKEQRKFYFNFPLLKKKTVRNYTGEVGAFNVCTQIILSQTVLESNELMKHFGGKSTQ